MPRIEPDAGPRLLLDDYGKGARQWLERFAADPKAPAASAPDPQTSQIHVLIEPQSSRTERWLERFAREQAEFGPYGGPPPNLKPGEAPELHLLIDDFSSSPRFVQQLATLVSRNGAARPTASNPPPALESESLPSRQSAEPRPKESETSTPPGAAPTIAGGEDIDLLLDWEDVPARTLRHRSQASSLAVHVVWIVILLLQPHVVPPSQLDENVLQGMETVALVAPPAAVLADLTRRSPDQQQVTEVLETLREPEPPAAVVQPAPAPAPAPVIEAPEPPKIEVEPAPEPVSPAPKLEVEQPRQPELAAASSPAPGLTRQGVNRPRLRPNELPVLNAPKRTNEPNLPANRQTATGLGQDGELKLGSLRLNARPDEVIEAATRNLIAGGGTQIVGDGYSTTGIGGSLPSSPANRGSTLELLSDPQGVDFRPYLIQVLAAVRRNWYAVIPESARLGMTRGRVAIQFIISKDGMVPKLVIADSSSVPHLDRAAVAGISASVPFQPLPSEFTGDEIRLQFSFLYNVKR